MGGGRDRGRGMGKGMGEGVGEGGMGEGRDGRGGRRGEEEEKGKEEWETVEGVAEKTHMNKFGVSDFYRVISK